MNLQPIKYESAIDVRLADLDSYGHVNSSHYLDLVSTARFNFLFDKFGMKIDDFIQKGLGFFLVRSVQNFKRPIQGIGKVWVESHVHSMEGSRVLVPYKILSMDREVTHMIGEMEFATVNLKTGKSEGAPEWILKYFFESES